MRRIQELTSILNTANRAYYQDNKPTMSDREYDALYDELVNLETETGIVLAGSPTRQVGYEVVGALTKATHDIPMLSLDKTKSPETLASFLGFNEGILSWKLDGLTIVLKYENGQLLQALTRGNGLVGEDVTHNAKVFANIPLNVPHKGSFDIRGEAVITLADFDEIKYDSNDVYKNPRNLCSGAVRQLNSETAAKRRVLFYAFGMLGAGDGNLLMGKKSDQLAWLGTQGFDIVEFFNVTAETVVQATEDFKGKISTAPWATDGLVLTFNDIAYSKSLGTTSKFPKDSIALKWEDELAQTTLLEIEWNTSRTGLINPVAIFNPVDIEGSQVSRASVHNVSILKELELIQGDQITVYKANMIIPQVAENLSHTGNRDVKIPKNCPVCGGETEIVGDPAVLYCTSPICGAQKVRSLSHFVSRDAMNIAGLSEQTLEKFVSSGLIEVYTDLFNLAKHKDIIINMEGFGQKSYDKLINAIEKSKNISLPNFIYALGIRHVGLANAKLLCNFFSHNPSQIAEICKSERFEDVLEIDGFGSAIAHSLNLYFSQEKNVSLYNYALSLINIIAPIQANNDLNGLTFVITGDVSHFDNRKAMQAFIEARGGRVSGSVSAKTSYLINNDATSGSGKNKKAAQLGVPIMTEAEFVEKYGL